MVVQHQLERLHVQFPPDVSEIHEKHREALRLVGELVVGCRAGQQHHQVGLLHPGNEHLLPVDEVPVAPADGGGLDPRRLRPGGRLGHGKGLEPELAPRDPRQVPPFLFVAAPAEQRAHRVHLRVAGARAAPGAVDLFEDDARLGEVQSRSSVRFGDEGRQIAGGGQRVHEGRRVLLGLVDGAPVLVRELLAEPADVLPNRLPPFRIVGSGFRSRLRHRRDSFVHPPARPRRAAARGRSVVYTRNVRDSSGG